MTESLKSTKAKNTSTLQNTATTAPLNLVTQINASHSLTLKLNTNNYSSWYLQFDTLLVGHDLKGYVDGSHPCPPSKTNDGSAINPEQAQWIRHDKLILHAIVVLLTEPIVPVISQCVILREVMAKLASQYASHTQSRVMALKKRLTNVHPR